MSPAIGRQLFGKMGAWEEKREFHRMVIWSENPDHWWGERRVQASGELAGWTINRWMKGREDKDSLHSAHSHTHTDTDTGGTSEKRASDGNAINRQEMREKEDQKAINVAAGKAVLSPIPTPLYTRTDIPLSVSRSRFLTWQSVDL